MTNTRVCIHNDTSTTHKNLKLRRHQSQHPTHTLYSYKANKTHSYSYYKFKTHEYVTLAHIKQNIKCNSTFDQHNRGTTNKYLAWNDNLTSKRLDSCDLIYDESRGRIYQCCLRISCVE